LWAGGVGVRGGAPFGTESRGVWWLITRTLLK
jgi:hypothetical protein